MRPVQRVVLCLLATVALAVVPAAAPAAPQAPTKRPTAVGTGGAAATVDPVGTRAAIDVLHRGGNAVDATIAAAAALGVVEPYSCGLGGGGFMTIYSARDGRVHAIDSRETAPAAMQPSGPNSFQGLTTFEQQRVSGMSVGVPGTVRGWELALDRFGSRPLSRLLRAGIRTARRGFVVDQTFYDQTDAAKQIFADFPSTAALYLDPDGTPRDVGTVIRNPDLARTYERLARLGPAWFYRGDVAAAILSAVRNPPVRPGATRAVRPGVMTAADLAAYRSLERTPTHVGYRGVDVYGMSPPSSGGSTVGESLNILERLAPAGLGAEPRERALHQYLEASRRAYADRNAYVGDPAYFPVPLRGLLSDSFAAERAATIGERAATSPVPPGDPYDDDRAAPAPTDQVVAARAGSTTHLTVSDRFGNVVSYTFTIEQTGGDGIVVPGYGFLLNNELTDFNLNADGSSTPGQANAVQGGKRPRSSIAPTIVLRDRRPLLAVGSPGGATIITTVLQVLIDRLDFGQTLPEAIAAPRLSQRNVAQTEKETNVPPDPSILAALRARGHDFKDVTEIGAATGIELRDRGVALAAAEPVRRGGGSAMVVRERSALGRQGGLRARPHEAAHGHQQPERGHAGHHGHGRM